MPVLNIELLSHGTVPCYDLEYSIDLLTNLFGFEVARTSKTSASFRLGGNFCFSVLQMYKTPVKRLRPKLIQHHFGLDVPDEQSVNAAYKEVKKHRARFKIRKITKPTYGHGTYFFYIVDADSNYWEVLMNPKDGYRYRFEQETDLRLFCKQDDNMKAEKQKHWRNENEI
jgi:catechol 2,3-dioxygenase-like lactoylglutathione lyase family enzyme